MVLTFTALIGSICSQALNSSSVSPKGLNASSISPKGLNASSISPKGLNASSINPKGLQASPENVSSNCLATFRAQALLMHNQFRALHNASSLVLNERLNNMAQQWAQSLASSDTGVKFDTTQGRNFGQNVGGRPCLFQLGDDCSSDFNFNFF